MSLIPRFVARYAASFFPAATVEFQWLGLVGVERALIIWIYSRGSKRGVEEQDEVRWTSHTVCVLPEYIPIMDCVGVGGMAETGV